MQNHFKPYGKQHVVKVAGLLIGAIALQPSLKLGCKTLIYASKLTRLVI